MSQALLTPPRRPIPPTIDRDLLAEKIGKLPKCRRAQIGRRRYYVTDTGGLPVSNEHLYPSVTTVLGATKSEASIQKLKNWQQNVGATAAKEYLAVACRRGNSLHKLMENFCRFGLNPSPEEVEEHVRPYWESVSGILPNLRDIVLVEQFMVNPVYRYAGTVDAVASLIRPGFLQIADWKTSFRYKRAAEIADYKIQLAAYCGMINRALDLRINTGVIVMAVPNGEAQVFRLEAEEMMNCWREWIQRLTRFHAEAALTPEQIAEMIYEADEGEI